MVNGALLRSTMDFCTRHLSNGLCHPQSVTVTDAQLVDLYLAADYLLIEGLAQLMCQKLALSIEACGTSQQAHNCCKSRRTD